MPREDLCSASRPTRCVCGNINCEVSAAASCSVICPLRDEWMAWWRTDGGRRALRTPPTSILKEVGGEEVISGYLLRRRSNEETSKWIIKSLESFHVASGKEYSNMRTTAITLLSFSLRKHTRMNQK